MTEKEALQRALRALNQIAKIVDATHDGADPDDACDEVYSVTGDVIGGLARAGFELT